MQLFSTVLLAAAATLASAASTEGRLYKRCSPIPNPDVPGGYIPPAPCWHTFTPDCQNHLDNSTEQFVSEARRTAVVMGVTDYCFDKITEEQAREADGRPNFGWRQQHGKMTRVPGTDILVITDMPEDTVQRYKTMTAA